MAHLRDIAARNVLTIDLGVRMVIILIHAGEGSSFFIAGMGPLTDEGRRETVRQLFVDDEKVPLEVGRDFPYKLLLFPSCFILSLCRILSIFRGWGSLVEMMSWIGF